MQLIIPGHKHLKFMYSDAHKHANIQKTRNFMPIKIIDIIVPCFFFRCAFLKKISMYLQFIHSQYSKGECFSMPVILLSS